jgi:cell division septation protein DedD
MSRWGFLSFIMIPCVATIASPQSAANRAMDPVFARAQALVSDGNGTAGRALVDSVLKATPPSAPIYPQALFWRASLASNAADAESDYKHIVVDYPLAPQAEDALLRLAQLELARGDRDAALSHLQRIPRDYPRSKSLARANYWIARVLFEKNDVANACSANATALSGASADEIELRNQIQYQGQRCSAVAGAPSTKPVQKDSATAAVAAVAAPSSTVAKVSGDSAQRDTTRRREPEVIKPRTEPEVVKPRAEPKDVKPSVEPAKAIAAKNAGPSRTRYSVQVAAYNRKPDAEKLASGLVKRGYEARVDGDVLPFRVRIGLYSTSAEAEDALKKLKTKHMDGFVVRAPER